MFPCMYVSDDLDIAPDFFEYFMALHPILKSDPTLWCISAWNDNGKEGLTEDDPGKQRNRYFFRVIPLSVVSNLNFFGISEILYRTDFFPGLGWMLTRDLWMELESKWPKA